jgi:hypothetical protein
VARGAQEDPREGADVRTHGSRACYVWGPEGGRGKGCRCFPCRVANARAVSTLSSARRPPWRLVYVPVKGVWNVIHTGTWEVLVRTRDREEAHRFRDELNRRDASADPVWLSAVEKAALRKHLNRLQAMGLSVNAIARAAGVNRKTITSIKLGYDPAPDRDRGQGHRPKRHRGGPRRTRRGTAERLLAVGRSQAGNCDLIDAGETWELLETLCRAGYPKAQIAGMLGSGTPSLQFRRDRITGRTARRVRDLFERLWKEDPRVRLAMEGESFPRRIHDRFGAWRRRDDSELVRLADQAIRRRERCRGRQ